MSACPKLLIFGIDGADPHLLQRFIDDGSMPNTRALVARGTLLPLRSTTPPTTFPAWTNFMTGVEPSHHGVGDFSQKIGYRIQFIGAPNRASQTWMEYLEHNGLRVGFAGFPASYPPLPLNGYAISGWDSPVTVKGDASFVHPPELYQELEQRFGSDVLGFDVADEFSDTANWYEQAATSLVDSVSRKANVYEYLLQRYPTDVAAFYFGESDTVAHHFWAFFDTASPRYIDGAPAPLKNAIANVYAAVDKAIGQLLAAVGPQTQVICVSDHGSTGNNAYQVYLNRMLYDAGLLSFQSSSLLAANSPAVRSRLPALVPAGLRRHLFKFAGGLIPSLAESAMRFRGIDWANTYAFSEEIPYAPAIWINQLGREPQGIVRHRDRTSIIDKIGSAVDGVTYPDGQSVFNNMHLREHLHDGPFKTAFPDIILEWKPYNGYNPVCQLSQGKPGAAVEVLTRDKMLGRKGTSMPGGHATHGIFASSTNDIPLPAGALQLHHLFDIICDLVDIWPPEASRQQHSVWERRGYTAIEQRTIARRLKQMGYLD